MSDLRSLESFLRTVEAGSFSAAAKRLGLTPAAVSKHVAKLEREFGTRLFQRSTRSLTLTEAGERLYAEAAGPARSLGQTLAMLSVHDAEPTGTLRVSIAPGFACQHVLPLMPAFLERYPGIRLDWSLESRRVDLVTEGFDCAIGAGFAVDAQVVARKLVPIKLMTVAAPAYLAAHGTPARLEDLAAHDCIRLRSATTGRLREWSYVVAGETRVVPVDGKVVLSDVDAVCEAALAGLGIARLGAHHVLPHLASGRLVQLLPSFPTPGGSIDIYYNHRLAPSKVRVFVDFLAESFASKEWFKQLEALP